MQKIRQSIEEARNRCEEIAGSKNLQAFDELEKFVLSSGVTSPPCISSTLGGEFVDASWDLYPGEDLDDCKTFTLRFDPSGTIMLEMVNKETGLYKWEEIPRDMLIEFMQKYLPTQ